ncbi:thiamine-phosphate kinase [Bacillus shivajii]|uniref:thiamine-phosphate kinase n=1 Tax=Bacillus shivajii TaxID=1983719 RepID=UPI001CFB0727|nr:thiamine-phosphate kinase [Bacillus shivajii]UCZ53698.1 thiamine-phosphate kinase [Bacillus shivajii]
MNNELNWIKSVKPTSHHQPTVKTGIGDDAAVVESDDKFDSVLAVDTMVEGVHFTKETMPIQSIGYKALAVNISDLAAMGAIPQYYLVSIAIPKQGWKKDELDILYKGLKEIGDSYGMDLIGGDTVSTSSNLVLTVTVIGKVEKNAALLRSSAKPGDVLFTTGQLGLSAFGLEKLLEHGHTAMDKTDWKPYIEAHQQPQPQVEAGRILINHNWRVALNDVSDGLASEAKEIADASHVNICIERDELEKAPLISKATEDKQESWMLYGGEDFQLVGTVSRHDWPKVVEAFERKQLKVKKIGYVERGHGQVFLIKDGVKSELKNTGYDHL